MVVRLPQPGGDSGQWGEILNEYLLVAHNTDGTPKAPAAHTHTASAITDSTAIGRSVLTGSNAAAVRLALGIPTITVAVTPPTSPEVGDIWVDLSA